jgi:5-methylcytosine-specific restriction endonuclease McrA
MLPVKKKTTTPQQRWARKNRDKLAAACRRWRARHPEKQKAATYNWRQRNLKRWNAYQRSWRHKNRHRTNPILRAFRAANKNTLYAKRRDYRRRNLEQLRAAARKYYRANCERKRVEHDIAIARRKLASGAYTVAEWRLVLRKWKYKCAYCRRRLTKKTATADHIIPLSRGGTNWIDNIVPACLPCNQRKNFLSKAEFLTRLRKLRNYQ